MSEEVEKKKEARRAANPKGVGLLMGVGAGLALGVALNNLAIGASVGSGIGLIFELGLAQQQKFKDQQ